ncbi:hypothetical protein [Streptomyces europaeiscabiei]|uniref:hypothetical protein n=1 Tax=Streptomyces europaeiscabiei TaxID=146819 RepID=UPI002E0E71D0|nr:hypothetical protein OHB30_33170 [Streptomyces europaeiscabiei]
MTDQPITAHEAAQPPTARQRMTLALTERGITVHTDNDAGNSWLLVNMEGDTFPGVGTPQLVAYVYEAREDWVFVDAPMERWAGTWRVHYNDGTTEHALFTGTSKADAATETAECAAFIAGCLAAPASALTGQTPTRPAYQLPDARVLGTAATEALEAARRANERLGRVMAIVTAAAVRDILTGHEAAAPFDAVRAELVEGEDGSLFPTGRYWTAAGDERTFTEAVGASEAGNGIHGMSEWTVHLDDDNRHVWEPLCTELPDRDRRPAWGIDLVRAAALDLDA